MGFFKQVRAALRPSSAGHGPDAPDQPDDEGGEATLDALTPEERAAYEGNAAAVARRRAEAEASRAQAKAARDDDPAG